MGPFAIFKESPGPLAPPRAGNQYHAHQYTVRIVIFVSPAKPLPPRDTHGPTPLSQCGPVADLASRAREVDCLSQRIVPLLPAPLREHVGFAGLRNDRVLLLVESSAWATRARMDQARILAAVHSLGLSASSVAAKVAPRTEPAGDSATTRPLSPRDAQSIRDAATAMADPDLRALFLELADLAESPTVSSRATTGSAP